MGMGMYLTARTGLRALFWLMGGMEVRGRENVPPGGRLIVASNHASYWDPMILGAAFNRPLNFMARRSLFANPFFGWLIRQTFAFPLDREGDSREALKTFGRHLDDEKAVVLFPEGTRTNTGYLGEIKSGVGMLSTRNKSPVLPVYIWGSYLSWPRGQKYPGRHRLKVFIGKPIQPPGEEENRKTGQQRVTNEMADRLHSLEEDAWRGEEPAKPLELTADSGESNQPTE